MFQRVLRSEALKATTQRTVAKVVAIPLLLCMAIAIVEARQVGSSLRGDPGAVLLEPGTSALDIGPDLMAGFGFVPAILGVLLVASEYPGGQWVTTLLATPNRGQVLAAKAVLCAAGSFLLGSIYATGILLLCQSNFGLGPLSVFASGRATEYFEELTMGILYWVLIGLVSLALAISWPSRIMPIVVMALLSFTGDALLFLNPAFRYLPTIAGMEMFASGQGYIIRNHPVFGPLAATFVVAGWALFLGALAWLLLGRRDIGGRRTTDG